MIELLYHTFISENMGVVSTRPRPFYAVEPPLLEFLEITTGEQTLQILIACACPCSRESRPKSKHGQQKRPCLPSLPQSQAFFHTIQNRTSFRHTEGQTLEVGGSALSVLQHFSQRKTSILGQRQYLDFEKHNSEP